MPHCSLFSRVSAHDWQQEGGQNCSPKEASPLQAQATEQAESSEQELDTTNEIAYINLRDAHMVLDGSGDSKELEPLESSETGTYEKY